MSLTVCIALLQGKTWRGEEFNLSFVCFQISEGLTPEAAKEAVHKSAKEVEREPSSSNNTLYLAGGAAAAALGLWFYMQPSRVKKPAQ